MFLDLDSKSKYALMLMDFDSGNTVDVVQSRRSEVTEPYFAAIPKDERLKVKYLISDMYAPYLEYINKYFPKALPVVDSFHVIQWICHFIDQYLRNLLKKYKDRDEQKRFLLEKEKGFPVKIQRSKEVYLLQKHRWIILSNNSNINYNAKTRYDRVLRQMVSTYTYEELFFALDPNLKEIRDLKEQYITFNSASYNSFEHIREELDSLILQYKQSHLNMFNEFSKVLNKYKEPIINSFKVVECTRSGERTKSRLSNGPMESLNRKPKDLKRITRGFRNFNHMRNRILYATRTDAPILAVPRKKDEYATCTGRKRGPYKK